MQNQQPQDSSIRSTSQPRLILKRKLSKWQKDPTVLPQEDHIDFILMELYPIMENGELSQSYIEIIRQLSPLPLIHIGIWLPFEETQQLYLNMTGKKLQKSTMKQESPFYFSYPHYEKNHNCHYIFLIGPYEEEINRQYFSRQANKIFWKYPQIIITNDHIREKFNFIDRVPSLQKLLNFKQNVLIYSQNNRDMDTFQNFNSIPELSKDYVHQHIFRSLKQNSVRTIHQSKKIYIYIFNLLLHQFSNEKQYLQRAVSSFIDEDIEQRHNKQIQRIKSSLPFNEQELLDQLQFENEQTMKLLQQNIPILRNSEQQSDIISQTKRNIDAISEKIVSLNSQISLKRNQSLISSSYDRLLLSFQSEKVQKVLPTLQSLSQDLLTFITQIQSKSTQVSSLIHTFNQFMIQNKKKYFRSVRKILQENKNNFKSMKQEEVIARIQIKKAMLSTLQKQVKALEQKRYQVQSQNDKLKSQGEKLHSQVNFSKVRKNSLYFDEANSNKTISLRDSAKIKDSIKMQSMKKQKSSQSLEKNKERTCCCVIF